MRIRLIQSISGTNGAYAAGEEVDWADDKDAARLIAAGIAEKVGPAKKANKVEKATAKKVVETATTD